MKLEKLRLLKISSQNKMAMTRLFAQILLLFVVMEQLIITNVDAVARFAVHSITARSIVIKMIESEGVSRFDMRVLIYGKNKCFCVLRGSFGFRVCGGGGWPLLVFQSWCRIISKLLVIWWFVFPETIFLLSSNAPPSLVILRNKGSAE